MVASTEGSVICLLPRALRVLFVLHPVAAQGVVCISSPPVKSLGLSYLIELCISLAVLY